MFLICLLFAPSLADTLFSLTNAHRAANDKPALTQNAILTALAQGHADALATADRYGDDGRDGHTLNGKGFIQRIRASGYAYAACAENVHRNEGAPAPADLAFACFRDSPVHNASMLRADFKEIGVGAAQSKSGKVYFVQVFGKPR